MSVRSTYIAFFFGSHSVGREIEISHELAGKVLEYESVLQSTAIALSELDCFISLARAAKEFNLRRPEMTESNTIIIKNGRCGLGSSIID